jgi:hypothetical protein
MPPGGPLDMAARKQHQAGRPVTIQRGTHWAILVVIFVSGWLFAFVAFPRLMDLEPGRQALVLILLGTAGIALGAVILFGMLTASRHAGMEALFGLPGQSIFTGAILLIFAANFERMALMLGLLFIAYQVVGMVMRRRMRNL